MNLPVLLQKKFVDGSQCKKCGGQCCKSAPGCYIPSDIGNTESDIKIKLLFGLRSGFYAVDSWDGKLNKEDNDEYGSIYFIRPRVKGNNKIYDASWGGECANLTENGCSLSFNNRPYECKLLIPKYENNEAKCHYPKWFSKKHENGKHFSATQWKPYQAIINECLSELGFDSR